MRKLIALVLCTLGMALAANAQLPGGNLYVGYSYFNLNSTFSPDDHRNFNGWDGAVEINILPFISGVADASGTYGTVREFLACPGAPSSCTSASPDASLHTFLFGPRLGFSVGKVRPFAEAMAGIGHASLSRASSVPSTSDTSLATAVGGGLDYKLMPVLGWRFEGDYVHTSLFNTKQSNFRITTGLVLRF
jgi:opacity protein-like surface antigen